MPGLAQSVLWIGGASGAGKSVAAWALFEALAEAGARVGFVDIDQLGMLYPASGDDPERHNLREEALVALAPGYAAAGAQVLLVSGVMEPRVGPAAAMASELNLTLSVLLADPAVLRERILARGWDQDEAEQTVAENTALREATFVDDRIETAGLSIAQTVERLRTSVRLVGSPRVVRPAVRSVRSPAELGVVVVTGPRAVGSSTVGFGLAMERWRAGLRTGFVDLQQLAFLAGHGSARNSDPALASMQFAVMHGLLAARGAGLLVAGGHLGRAERPILRSSLPMARVTVVRLRADATTYDAHVRDRMDGSAARLAGDDLLGADAEYQAAVVAAAIAEQDHLDAEAHDDAVLDVTGRSPADVVIELQRLVTSRHPS